MEKIKIIKIGGNILNHKQQLATFLRDFAELKGFKILVHGGGNSASDLSNKMGITSNMHMGRRITDAQTLEIVTMVFAGKINKNIVAQLQQLQCNALGIMGADGNSIQAKKRPTNEIDYGYVGDVVKVNLPFFESLLQHKLIPICCALTHDGQGQILNTNADTIASELAISLAANFDTELYYCFEKNGVLKDRNNPRSVISTIRQDDYKELQLKGIINEGMIPKIHNCFYALKQGVNLVQIGNSKMPFTENSIHTQFNLK